MKNSVTIKIFLLIFAYGLLIPLKLHASGPAEGIPVDLFPAVNNLLDFMESSGNTSLNLDKIPRILDFVEEPKKLGKSMSLGEHKGSASDYYEFQVNRSLKEVLELAYNPDLPSNLTQPSSVRLSLWTGADGKNVVLPSLSDKLDHLDKPLIINGTEYMENSPDTFSGAYYSYNVNRLLILMKYKGRPALISVSNQKGVSDVGKKGIILGNDENWDYIYSGEAGTTLPGTGWADTYMYGSASIMIYYELGTNPKQVKCAVFKWLDAGWLGINFVKPVHIRKGLERFAKDFREIVESPSLADIESLERMYQKIRALSLDELKARTASYYNKKTIDRFVLEDSKNRKWIRKLFKKGKYINKLNRQEMEALVSIEYLKYKLGKYNAVGPDYFPASPAEGKPYQGAVRE